MKKIFKNEGNVIICDLDGTLLNSESKITDYTLKTLELVAEHNILIYASGRKLERIVSKFPKKIFGDYIITQHGAKTYDIKQNLSTIAEHRISKNVFIEISNLIDKLGFDDELVIDQNYDVKWNVNNVPEYFYTLNIGKEKGIDLKLIPYLQKIKNADFFIMKESFNDLRWGYITAPNVSKGNAIKDLIKLKNIKYNEIICFGDSLNDISMFEVSTVKVAMGNAIDEIKDISDYITDDYNNDGVAKWLHKNILKDI